MQTRRFVFCATFLAYCVSIPLYSEGGYYDAINQAHENAHGTNEAVRVASHHANCAGFKLPSGEVFDMPEPRMSLPSFIASLPTSSRGPLFHYYFVKMGKQWLDKPSYVWDEWVGFLFGAQAELMKVVESESPRSTSDQLAEFSRYGLHLCHLLKNNSGHSPYTDFCIAMRTQTYITLKKLKALGR